MPTETVPLAVCQHLTFIARTRAEAAELAVRLAESFPAPGPAALGLHELLINAVEHGNLEIGGALKAQLLREGRLEEELARREHVPPYCDRVVTVELSLTPPDVTVTIADQGQGFDWRAVFARDLACHFEPNGRGIALTRAAAFPDLTYRGRGNVAVVTARGA